MKTQVWTEENRMRIDENPDVSQMALVTQEIDALSRVPFQRALQNFLSQYPEPKQLKEFANKYPEKWANAINTLAKLSGYSEKASTEINIFTQINNLSDADLQQKLQEIQLSLDQS